VVTDDRYENLGAFKALVKTLPADLAERFMEFWVLTEDRLNREFRVEGPTKLGDSINLWRELPTRTLTLTRKDAGSGLGGAHPY
jgi:hypothetical protein